MENHPAHSRFNSLNNPKSVILILAGVLLIGMTVLFGMSFSSSNNAPSENSEQDQAGQQAQELNLHSVVYGVWSGQGSEIHAYDVILNKDYILGTLPINVKRITILSPQELLFINKTKGDDDRGEELAIYNTKTGQTTTLVKADAGYGIDEYAISHNKQYIALWETQLSAETGILTGGRSKVAGLLRNQPGNKTLLYDEVVDENSAVHYPIGILDNGTVFLDRFDANTTTGWARGMSYAKIDGSQRTPIPGMEDGTYGSQPMMSPDGRYIAVLGYDGSKGSGIGSARTDMRRASISSNSVELLDTATLQRIKLPNLSTANTYSYPMWDELSGNLMFNVLSKNVSEMGKYVYNIAEQKAEKVTISPELTPFTMLANGELLTGVVSQIQDVTGNIGGSYSTPVSQFYITKPSANTQRQLNTTAPLMQYISYYDGKYLAKEATGKDKSNEKLQLQTLYFKPKLETTRITQQSSGRCRDYAAEQCNEIFGTNYSGEEALAARIQYLNSFKIINGGRSSNLSDSKNYEEGFSQCVSEQWDSGQVNKLCSDSPLYLYGPEGLAVDVKIWTPIYDSVPSDNKGTYSVILEENGLFSINGNIYSSIAYDYMPARDYVTRPEKGYIVEKNNVVTVVESIVNQFGLNEKETADLLQKTQEATTGKYVFVSFFDHKTSQSILPITFSPKPDVYRNIVFYFKNYNEKPQFSVEAPRAEKIERKGFTAIEISEIVE